MEHKVFYYGNDEQSAIKTLVEKYHPKVESPKPIPESIPLVEQATEESKIYFVHRDQVQTDLLFMSKQQQFDVNILPVAEWFNSYYGSGLSSVFFQEIREAKGLAYTAYCRYDTPSKADNAHYFRGYIGTQPDKLEDALSSAMNLLTEMPVIENQIEASRTNILKKIASDRKVKDQKYFYYLSNLQKGLNYDNRKDVYEFLQKGEVDQLKSFFTNNIKGNNYTFMVMGNRNDIDMKTLEKYGKITEISLEDLFGY